MRETMYELLSYEPYESISGPEKRYILSVLDTTGKTKAPKDTKYQKLFEAFYNNRDKSDLSWLTTWIKTYKTKRTYPKLLKKMCYYYMLNHGHTNASVLEVLGLKEDGKNSNSRKLLNKWNLYADYRKESEEHKHISLPIHRRGLKQEYLTKFIQMVYYEAHRQAVNGEIQHLDFYTQNKEKRAKKKDLPVFVDVFGGTGSVAASMNVASNHKVVNEFDKIALGTLFVLIHFPEEFLERYQQFNLAILRGDYENYIREIFTKDYDVEDSKKGNEKTRTPNGRDGLWYYTDANIKGKIKAKYRKGWDDNTLEVVKKLRNAWFYCEAVLVGWDDYRRFHSLDPDEYQKHWWTVNYQYEDKVTRQKEEYIAYEDLLNSNKFPKMQSEFEKMLLGACYFIYYHSFNSATPSGEPSFRTVTVNSYRNMLFKYFDLEYQLKLDLQNYELSKQYKQMSNEKLKNLFKNNETEKTYLNSREKNLFSKYLLNVNHFIPNVSCLDEWRNSLLDAILGTKSFEKLFIRDEAFYYLDSPYIFTSQYNAGFTDEQHKEMLDKLRKHKFKWLFSMQFNFPDVKNGKKDEGKRGDTNYIANYLTYLEGFLCELVLDEGEYRSNYDINEKYEGIFAIFVDGKNANIVSTDELDEDAETDKEDIKEFFTKEIFITNVDVRRITPFNYMYIQLPLKKLIAYYNAHYVKLGGDIENDPANITEDEQLRRLEGRELLHEYMEEDKYRLYKVNFDTSYKDIVQFAKNEKIKELVP